MDNSRHWLWFISVIFFEATPKLLQNPDFCLELMLIYITAYPPLPQCDLFPHKSTAWLQDVPIFSKLLITVLFLECQGFPVKAELVLMLLIVNFYVCQTRLLLNRQHKPGPNKQTGWSTLMVIIYTLAEILPGSQTIWPTLEASSQKYASTHLLSVSRGALVPPAPWVMLAFLLAVMVISALCKPRALKRRQCL